MKIETLRRFALALEAVTEAPHHDHSSFRVRGKIFVTVPPNAAHIHVFVGEDDRAPALAIAPASIEKLLWGGKVVGLRIELATAGASLVKSLVRKAYETRVRQDAGPKAARPRGRAKPGSP